MNQAGNFLIVKLAAGGDVLLATALTRALRRARPRATIGWITSRYAAPLLEGNPDLNAVLALTTPQGSVLARVRFAREWMTALRQWRRHHGPATVLLAHRSRLLVRTARASRAARVLAWDDPVPFRRDRHRLELLAGLLTAAGVAAPAGQLRPRLELEAHERAQGETAWVARHFLPWSLPLVARSAGFDSRQGKSATGAFCPAGAQGSSKLPPSDEAGAPRWVLAPGGAANPWAAMPNRCWPRERFLELAGRALTAGVTLAWVGGAADAPLIAWIRQSLPPDSGRDYAGRLSLRLSAAVIAAADLVIGNDSLPLVMAHALGRPAIGLYGPTAGVRIHAPGQPYLQGWAGCGPCYDERAGRRGQAYLCPHARCLEEISVDEVWSAACACRRIKESACAI